MGEVNFDSIIIADFDENLKSVATSFLYSDVNSKKTKFITLNQWFDKSLFKENSTNQIYFPSINIENYNKFNETYFMLCSTLKKLRCNAGKEIRKKLITLEVLIFGLRYNSMMFF